MLTFSAGEASVNRYKGCVGARNRPFFAKFFILYYSNIPRNNGIARLTYVNPRSGVDERFFTW